MPETRTRLSSLCDFVGIQVDPVSSAEGVYVGLEHVASGRFERIGQGKPEEVQSSKFAFQRDDVLYGKLRPYLDKAVLANDAGICSTELLVLRPREGVDPRFLVGLVHAPSFVAHAVSGTTGVQHPRTSWSHIADFELPNFEPTEQTRIADILWQVSEAIAANEAVLEAGVHLKRVAMQALFTGGLMGESQKEAGIGTIPESWIMTSLGEVATLERGRFLHRPRNEPRFYGGSTPFVQTGDVVRSNGRIREYSQSLNREGVRISRVFPAGTILITIAANIGYTGVLEFDAACPDSLVAISAGEAVGSQFLEYWLQSQQVDMDRLAPKGTQKNINIQFLRSWPVIVPPSDEQHEIVVILSALDRKIDFHRRKRAVLDELFKALLHKLMTGEIRVSDLDLSALNQEPAEGATA